jgi:hypothetical protein
MNIRLITTSSLLFLCSLRPSPCLAAEDPARFLSVPAWQGSLTRSANDAGSGQYMADSETCDQRWTLNHSSSLTVSMALDSVGLSSRTYFTYANATPFSILDELKSEECRFLQTVTRSGSTGARIWNEFPPAGSVSMFIDANAGTYTIHFDLPIGYQILSDGTPIPTYAQVSWFWNNAGSNSGPSVTRPLPASGMIISGSATNSLTDAALHTCVSFATASAWNDMIGNLVITWNLTPKTNVVELEVEIKDAATGTNYDHWLPLGNLEEPEKPGSSLKFIARLVKPDGTAATDTASAMNCTLAGVSHEPGVCMNFPIDGATNPDFKLLQSLNFPPNTATFWLVNGETSMRTVYPGITSAEGIVSCYDYGAYATIKVTATVNGEEIIGYFKGDPRKEKGAIRLPKRPSTSKIAEGWKKNEGLADNDDNDNVPVGDGHKGDGYSVYEEYRGFAENGVQIRTDPKVKDLFVRDRIGHSEAKQELLKFQAISKILVHHQLRDDEISGDNVMNFNADTAHLHTQHGVALIPARKDKAHSEAVAKVDDSPVSTPGSYSAIEIVPAGTRSLFQKFEYDGDAPIFIETAYQYQSIAHELGHACSVWHHGDCDPQDTIWASVSTPDGVHVMREVGGSGQVVTICNQNGTPAILSLHQLKDSMLKGMTVYLGTQNGQQSGNIDCLMCYHAAGALKRDSSGKRYLISLPNGSRSLFCTSAQGTGYNAPGRQPFPLFGNAHEKRGNCKEQLCVNDAYVDALEHNRDYNCSP